jgi:transglutaminase-like putative cysteine protease
MLIEIDTVMDYQLCGDETVLLTLEAAATEGQTLLETSLEVENATLHRIDGESRVGGRVWAAVTTDRLKLRYRAKVDVTRSPAVLQDLGATRLCDLPGEVLSYLRPSRHAESDLFSEFVGLQFGHLNGGAKIDAIRQWVAAEIYYAPGSSNAATTAVNTFATRAGVCRDFTHLLCALARAANIPARYTSVYGADVYPPDFHAVAQVWLDGAWHLIDATGMSSPDTLVVIGVGRDAADVSFMETSYFVQPISQNIIVTRGNPAA